VTTPELLCDPSSYFCNCGIGAYVVCFLTIISATVTISLLFAGRLNFKRYAVITIFLAILPLGAGYSFRELDMRNVRMAIAMANDT
jgi:hypothetical protein